VKGGGGLRIVRVDSYIIWDIIRIRVLLRYVFDVCVSYILVDDLCLLESNAYQETVRVSFCITYYYKIGTLNFNVQTILIVADSGESIIAPELVRT